MGAPNPFLSRPSASARFPRARAHEEPQQSEPAAQKPEPRAFQKPAPDQAGDKRPQKVLRQLSAGEMDARARALLEARKREDVEKREREIEEARLREEAQKRAIEDQKRRVEEEAARKVEEEVERQRAAEIAKANESRQSERGSCCPACSHTAGQSLYGVRGRMCGSCVLSPTNVARLPAMVKAARALQQKTAPAREAAGPRAKGQELTDRVQLALG